MRSIDSPVMFPPGRARLATCPRPTGSAWLANTMGIVLVACRAGSTKVEEAAKMTCIIRSVDDQMSKKPQCLHTFD